MKCEYCSKEFPYNYRLKRHLNSKVKCTDVTNTENIIKRSKEKFPGRFLYHKTIYVNAETPIVITCKKHNDDISILHQNHLKGNGGCTKCSGCYVKQYNELVEEFNVLHSHRYIYDDKTECSYKNSRSILKIKCPQHGYFERTVSSHKNNDGGCDKCFVEFLDRMHTNKLSTIDLSKTVYFHPTYTNYSININTDIITNVKTKRTIKGAKTNRGSTKLNLSSHDSNKNVIYLHTFKYESVYNEIIHENCEIDHRDQDPSNNSIENLQCLTKLQHGRKTAVDNPDRGVKVGKTQGVGGTAYNPSTKNTIFFDSINDLAIKIKNSQSNIHRFLRSGKSPPRGYSEITFDSPENIEGEQWKKHPLLEFYVSNMGRIQSRRRVTRGSLDGEGLYYTYSSRRVHLLVMETFGGEKPNKNSTIDHLNNNTKDNRITNLRWATKSEQCLNQRIKQLIKPRMINGYTGEVLKSWNSMREMKEENVKGITIQTINNVSSQKRDWFINLNHSFLNKDRLEFVKSVLGGTKKNMKVGGTPGVSETNTKKNQTYHYILNPTKFYTNKKLIKICKSKKISNAYNEIKSIAIKHNSARTIQCYYRSFHSFHKISR